MIETWTLKQLKTMCVDLHKARMRWIRTGTDDAHDRIETCTFRLEDVGREIVSRKKPALPAAESLTDGSRGK